MQSLEMGQKSCRLIVRQNGARVNCILQAGSATTCENGSVEGDDAVYKVVLWTAEKFEIGFQKPRCLDRKDDHDAATRRPLDGSDAADGRGNRDTVGAP